jgi:hypothetical protein
MSGRLPIVASQLSSHVGALQDGQYDEGAAGGAKFLLSGRSVVSRIQNQSKIPQENTQDASNSFSL